MDETAPIYRSALRVTLRTTAAAYGYTLTISTTAAVLMTVHGKPRPGDLFLFVAGGLIAFAGLDALLTIGSPSEHRVEQVFPFAGSLNFVSVPAALGAATGVAYAISAAPAWLLAPLAATAIYMVLVAAQLTLVDVVRDKREE
jgi:hypothetical protein